METQDEWEVKGNFFRENELYTFHTGGQRSVVRGVFCDMSTD